MDGALLLRMLETMTPDNARRLAAAGCERDVRVWLGTFQRLVTAWRRADVSDYGGAQRAWLDALDRMACACRVSGMSDGQVWVDIQMKLDEVRDALESE